MFLKEDLVEDILPMIIYGILDPEILTGKKPLVEKDQENEKSDGDGDGDGRG